MNFYQTENFGKTYDFRTNIHENWNIVPHIHEFSEIAITRTGITTVFLNGKKILLPPDHLIFILPNQIHSYSSETASIMRCAVFSNDHIPAFFQKLGNRELENPVLDLCQEPDLLQALEETGSADTLMLCSILNLLCHKLLLSTPLIPARTEEDTVLHRVIRYIAAHFQEDIQLKILAHKLGYHEKYLSSTLHTLTGMNFRAFLASYRVQYAKTLLHSREGRHARISDIAHRCGFASINSFNRAFRSITGMTPTEYQKRHPEP